MKFSLTASTVRHFPNAPFPKKALARVDVARNEGFSFQAAVRTEEQNLGRYKLTAEAPKGWSARVRVVGLVPAAHHNTPVLDDPLDNDGIGHIPGLVPDPLLDEDVLVHLACRETRSFWISVKPAGRMAPGNYKIGVALQQVDRDGNPQGRPLKRSLTVVVHDVVLKPLRDFHITHWFYADALFAYYHTNYSDERFWTIVESYMRDVVAHGQDTLYVPVFTPPLDGVKIPSQLLRVKRGGKGRYEFDWSDVRRWVELARKCGITHFEWCHHFTQWGVKNAIRIYEGQGTDEKLLWPAETEATSPVYKSFLSQYLPELKEFLVSEKILNKSFFHVSDEPHEAEHLENYRKARAMLKELAPWMKVMDALSSMEFANTKDMTDIPVPSISTALGFKQAGIPSWCYYCCGPRGKFLNRLLDTPLAKIAMHGFLFHHWGFGGFLHWGYNYWFRHQSRTLLDPFAELSAYTWPGWAYGDTFLVYPGENGPIDSMRWEVFAESLNDFRLLQTLGIGGDAPLLKSIRSFEDFPKKAEWRIALRRKLLSSCDK